MTLERPLYSTSAQRTLSPVRPRLRLRPKAPATGYADGAWWPRSEDLAAELPDLLLVVSARLGSIMRVIYNFGDWAKAPTELEMAGIPVELGGRVDTIQVVGANHNLVLLVVPPGTELDQAHDAMMSAANPEDSSTIEDLFRDMIENDG